MVNLEGDSCDGIGQFFLENFYLRNSNNICYHNLQFLYECGILIDGLIKVNRL